MTYESAGDVPEHAALMLDDKCHELNVIRGTNKSWALDIGNVYRTTGAVTLDNGFANTASCSSKITYVDGEEGALRYRGIPIEQLCEHSSFTETSYLLLHNRLPTAEEKDRFSDLLNEFSLLHEDMRHFYNFFPRDAHPMDILGTMVNALSSFYPNVDARSMTEEVDISATRLISKIRTLAAFAYKKSIGEPVVYPRGDYSYCKNFLNMMHSSPVKEYDLREDRIKALSTLLILHADHEQNCSTSTVRLVGSSQAHLYASIASGIAALHGRLHGGANQAVVEMLMHIRRHEGDVASFIDRAKDKHNKTRLFGFGHRVYKNYDPRARVAKQLCHGMLEKEAASHELLDIALRLEEAALNDDYFIERKLFPNVDFYSGLIYMALDIPLDMFTVMFAIGRMPGWIAHWKEMINSKHTRIGRPRQLYTGRREHDYVPIEQR